MSSEQTLWQQLRDVPGYWWMRVENACMPGTPDVHFVRKDFTTGWLELKYVQAWPQREATPLRLPHFTKWQRAWLTRYPGECHMLLKVGRADYFLFPGPVAARYVGHVNRAQLLDIPEGKYFKKIAEIPL